MMKFEFKNETESVSLKIYDYVGDDGWGGGITAKTIENELANANNKPLNIYINSNGGEVFEGFAIYNILKRYEGHKTVYIDGIAASIASVIALCGDKVIMHDASMMMIHNASGCVIGNAEEMKKVVNALEQINEVIRDVYKNKTHLEDEKLKELMDNETFMTAKECVDYGFADEILNDKLTDEQAKVYTNSINELKNTIDLRIKTLNDVKETFSNLSPKEQVGNEVINDNSIGSNKKSHWAFLNNKGERNEIK